MNPMIKTCLIAIPFAGLFLQNAHAQTKNNINQSGTLVELCASAQQEVLQDSADVRASYSVENRDKRLAANEVNQKMTEVVQRIKAQYPQIEIDTQNYNSYQQYTRKGRSEDWTVQQTFKLKSKSPSEVPSLVSMLQEAGVTINGMNAYVSPAAAKLSQQKLYAQAFDDVNLRLRAMSQGMGKANTWRITHIDATGARGCGGNQMQSVAYGLAVKSADAVEVAEPTLEIGRDTIQLSLWIAAKMK